MPELKRLAVNIVKSVLRQEDPKHTPALKHGSQERGLSGFLPDSKGQITLKTHSFFSFPISIFHITHLFLSLEVE
jgi:hypothetical protein